MERLRLTKTKIAVLASGSGSNFEAIAQACAQGTLQAEIVCVVSDRAQAYALTRAEKWGIPARSFSLKKSPSKTQYEQDILAYLQEKEAELVILAGYMKIVEETFLEGYPNRILNIHPSLLPLYPGKQGIKDAYKDGAAKTGVTVHLVDAGIDTGPILAQKEVAVTHEDTLESLEEKIHTIEHQLYPKTIQTYIEQMKEK